MADIRRTAVSSIKYLLEQFPCVAVVGSRQVGKTTLLKQVLPKANFFDMEKKSDYERVKRDPDFFLSQYNEPVVIDESQLVPELFPALRVKIDSARKKNGQFLISGSSSPELLTNITESLAGRIAIFELGGLSLGEKYGKNGNSLYEILSQKSPDKLFALKEKLSRDQLLESCLRGGYPEIFISHDDAKSFGIWMDNYFLTYIRRDIRNIFPGLNIENYQRFISMLAGSSGQILNASEFARSLDVSQPTAKSYFRMASGTFVFRIIPSYQKNIVKRITKMPKGQMRDTGLLCYLLKIKNIESLLSNSLYGRIWETFVIEEILKGFANNLIKVAPYYYRTKNQAEIDLILEGDFGIIPVEIKSGSITGKKSLFSLEKFIEEQKLAYGIVINQSEDVTWLSKKVIQIPACYLCG